MGFGFKDSGGTGYKDTSVGYKEQGGKDQSVPGYGTNGGYKAAHGTGVKGGGFGLNGVTPQESGGLKTKTTAPDPADIARRIAEEKARSQKAFEQKQWEEQRQAEQRQFEDRQRQEQRAYEERSWQEKNSQNQ